MNFPSVLRGSVLAALLGGLAPAGFAQDLTPPAIVNPIADFTVSVDSAPTVISIKKTFGLTGVTGTLVRMTTNVGKIDLELFNGTAPNTVANFLDYVNSGSYTNTIFHRSTTEAGDGFGVIQGGGFTLNGNSVGSITTFGNVANEYDLPDTRGTIAMAKQADSPDSASDQWFINVSDNSDAFGSDNDGGFTVFGRVIERDLATVDAIDALKVYDLSSALSNNAFKTVPLFQYDESQNVAPSNLVVANSIAVLPLVSKGTGFPGAITVKVKGNSNPGLVTTHLNGRKLVLTYAIGQKGTAAITLQAKSAAKSKITHTFNVTVQ